MNLAKFLPDGAEKFEDLELFLNQADKTFTAAEVKKMRQTDKFPRSLNAYLDQYELSDAEKDAILIRRHTDYDSKSDEDKTALRKKVVKLRKIQEKI